MNMPSSVGPSSDHDVANQAAQSADAAIRSARQKAHDALDGLSDRMRDVKDQASATLESLRPQLDSVATYAREEPTKALLIAAATGAGIMGLVALMSRSSGGRALSAELLRNAAYDAGDNARRSARDIAREATDRASAKADALMKQTRGAAQNAYEGLSDTVQQWKDQAAPLVDRVRPQIDTVMTYAKDDPGKALLIAAAAGAALMGLMSSLNRS
jgi:ElaB/YqjD/DUF883 family membrane-anchored ribosome-binding protein